MVQRVFFVLTASVPAAAANELTVNVPDIADWHDFVS